MTKAQRSETLPAPPQEKEITAAKPSDQRPKPPRFTLTKGKNGAVDLEFVAEDKVAAARELIEVLGSCDPEFASGILRQLIDATREGRDPKSQDLNFALQVIGAIKPRDELEATLATQMATVHMAAMRYMRLMNNAELLTQLEVHERTSSRLMRTFAMQMEALRKHRSGGEQRVIVKHVTVNEGGNAIVGNVSSGGGRGAKEN